MIFNGHTHKTIAELDDVTMAQLQTMYADGLLGNRAILELLATLTTGVFNYMRADKSPPYKLVNILGNAYDYLYPPVPEKDKKEHVNNQLLTFLSQAPGFNMKQFEVANG